MRAWCCSNLQVTQTILSKLHLKPNETLHPNVSVKAGWGPLPLEHIRPKLQVHWSLLQPREDQPFSVGIFFFNANNTFHTCWKLHTQSEFWEISSASVTNEPTPTVGSRLELFSLECKWGRRDLLEEGWWVCFVLISFQTYFSLHKYLKVGSDRIYSIKKNFDRI